MFDIRPNALEFDGLTSYASVASVAIATTPITMAAWVFVDPASVSEALSTVLQVKNSTSAASTNMWALRIASGGQIRAESANATLSSSSNAPYAAANRRWFHSAGTFASATNRVGHINGTPGTAQTSNRVPSGLDSTTIGASLNSGAAAGFFPGAVAHAAIWNVVLAQSDIHRLASGVLPPLVARESLVAYWPLMADGLPPGHDYMQAFPLTWSGGRSVIPGPFSRPRPYLIPAAVSAGKPYHYYAQQRRQAA